MREPYQCDVRIPLNGECLGGPGAYSTFTSVWAIALMGESIKASIGDRVDSLLIALWIMVGSEAMDLDIDPRERMTTPLRSKVRRSVARMTEFTFGHEFAHLILGHLNLPGSDDLAVYNPSDEFAADTGVVRNISGASAGSADVAAGGYDTLLALHFSESMSAIRSELPSFPSSATHPPAIERLASYHDGISKGLRRSADRLERDAGLVDAMIHGAVARLEAAPRKDLLTFYGSIHLAGLGGRPGVDRIDF